MTQAMMAEEVDVATGLAFLHAALPGKPSQPQQIFEPVQGLRLSDQKWSDSCTTPLCLYPQVEKRTSIRKDELESYHMLRMGTWERASLDVS